MGIISKIEDKLSGHSGKEAEQQAGKQAQNYMGGQHGGSGGGLQQQAEKQYMKHEMNNATGGSSGNSSGLGGLEQKTQGLALGGGHSGSGATMSGTSGGYGGSSASGITPQTAERYGSSGATSGMTGGAPPAAGVGAGSGAAGAGLSSGVGSVSRDLRHPVGSGGHGGYIPPSGSAVNNPAYPGNGGQRVTSGTTHSSAGAGSNKTQASEPYDPYSSAGQRTAADAAPNVGGAGYGGASYGQTGQALAQDQPRTSYDEQGIPRSAHGGITNSSTINDRNFVSGPTSYMSNPEAVPTAGGRAIGNVQDSHTGRDAALGAGAAGAGAYGLHEEQKHGRHGHHGHHGHSGSAQPGSTSYEQTPSTQHHHGRDAALATGGAGAGAYGAHEAGKHHGQQAQGTTQNYAGQGVSQSDAAYGQGASDAQRAVGGVPGVGGVGSSMQQPTQSTTTSAGTSSSTVDPSKLGGAYEAGYRDALRHIEAERQRLGQQ